MILSKFPDCCGYGILHHIDRWPSSSNFLHTMKRRVKKAFFTDNRAGLYAIYAQGQHNIIKTELENFGWKLVRQERNRNTNNILYTYFLENTHEIRAKLT